MHAAGNPDGVRAHERGQARLQGDARAGAHVLSMQRAFARLPQPSHATHHYHIVGVPSNGIHANGFSLVRKILRRYSLTHSGLTLDDFLQPTRIYSDTMAEITRLFPTTVADGHVIHVTGGGLVGNLQRLYQLSSTTPSYALPNADNFTLPVSRMPPVFRWLAIHGPVSHHEMLHTFNCGYGLVYLVSKTNNTKASLLIPKTHQIIGSC